MTPKAVPSTRSSAPHKSNAIIIAVCVVLMILGLNYALTAGSAASANGKRFSFLPNPSASYSNKNLACGFNDFPKAKHDTSRWEKDGLVWRWHFAGGIRSQHCED